MEQIQEKNTKLVKAKVERETLEKLIEKAYHYLKYRELTVDSLDKIIVEFNLDLTETLRLLKRVQNIKRRCHFVNTRMLAASIIKSRYSVKPKSNYREIPFDENSPMIID